MKILQIDPNLSARNFTLELADLPEVSFVLRVSFLTKIFRWRHHLRDSDDDYECTHTRGGQFIEPLLLKAAKQFPAIVLTGLRSAVLCTALCRNSISLPGKLASPQN